MLDAPEGAKANPKEEGMKPRRGRRSAEQSTRPPAAKSFTFAIAMTLVAFLAATVPTTAQINPVAALQSEAFIVSDDSGVPHICAHNEADALLLQGFSHATDRLFQMDFLRRTFSGTLSEFVGPTALAQDVQFRILDLGTGAEQTVELLRDHGLAETLALLEAYTAGVNLAIANNPLPPEYAALERTSVAPWTVADTLLVGRGVAFGLSFDLDDLDRSTQAQGYAAAGDAMGFDGSALFFEDIYRSAPITSTVTVSSAISGSTLREATSAPRLGAPHHATQQPTSLERTALELAERVRERLASLPALAPFVSGERIRARGSNWWVIAPANSATGAPLLASDPHLALNTPATLYENHLMVAPAGDCGLLAPAPGGTDPGLTMNLSGMSFPGVPWVAMGCNASSCWAPTLNPVDVTDVYQESLVLDPVSGLPTATLFEGKPEPVTQVPQQYRQNMLGDGIPDNLETVDVPPNAGGVAIYVPRRNHGPLVDFQPVPGAAVGLSVQYTGWGPSFDIHGLRQVAHAQDVEAFRDALQFFDIGSSNWSYADTSGNIAYFASGELPLREDLQTLSFPDGGIPPFLLRDGTHALRHEWLLETSPQPGQSSPYRVLPFAEMPQSVNPASGILFNANNDPVGTTLDNDPLNQLRPGGGLYYLSPGYADGLRAGRIAAVLEDRVTGGGKVSLEDLTMLQADNQLSDAELVSPFLIDAYDHAASAGAPSALGELANDSRVAEAIARIRDWDFTTPTGLERGYDPGDDPENLAAPTPDEIANSVATTIWSVFRGQLVQRVVDQTLGDVGLEGPGSLLAYRAVVHQLRSFDAQQGVGASGLVFFDQEPGLSAAQGRDLTLLRALRDSLDLLAGDAFAPAFANSTELGDYRWGALHRIVFDHALGGPFSVPPAGGFASLAPELPGVARAGGYQTVDAASHSVRADGAQDFRFGSGPVRRFVGELMPEGPRAEQILPGGQSGILGSDHATDQLGRWLTNAYKPVLFSPADVVAHAVDVRTFEPERETCVPDDTTLCLHDGRFTVQLTWNTGGSAQSATVSASSDSSGVFSFYNADNWEVLVKVLDGCAINGRFWVFAAPATHLAFLLTVRDLETQEILEISKPLGPTTAPLVDLATFDGCP